MEENRSLTQLSEFALAAFLDTRRRGDGTENIAASPSPAEARKVLTIPQDPQLGDMLSLAGAVLQSQFGAQGTALLLLIAFALSHILATATDEHEDDPAWLSNPFVFHHVKGAIQFLLETIEPEMDPASPPGSLKHGLLRNGVDVGYVVASFVAHSDGAEIGKLFGSFGEKILDGLGDPELARLRSRVEKLWISSANDPEAQTKTNV
jgi:hypothetical protein